MTVAGAYVLYDMPDTRQHIKTIVEANYPVREVPSSSGYPLPAPSAPKSSARSCAVCHTSAFLSALNVPFCCESSPCMANSANTAQQATDVPLDHPPGGPLVARTGYCQTLNKVGSHSPAGPGWSVYVVCGKKRAHFEPDILVCAVAARARTDAGLTDGVHILEPNCS